MRGWKQEGVDKQAGKKKAHEDFKKSQKAKNILPYQQNLQQGKNCIKYVISCSCEERFKRFRCWL